MRFYLFLIVGFLVGIPAGMGFGGGTLLIPALTVFFGVDQRIAQGVNLLSFLPMAAFALARHKKNGLVQTQGLQYMAIPAVIFAVLSSVTSFFLPSRLLRKIFGGFLIVLATAKIIMFFQKKF